MGGNVKQRVGIFLESGTPQWDWEAVRGNGGATRVTGGAPRDTDTGSTYRVTGGALQDTGGAGR